MSDQQLIVEMRLLADPAKMKLVRHMVREVGHYLQLSEQVGSDIVLAVDEACQNIIRHAYANDPNGDILIQFLSSYEKLVIELHDHASKVDPNSCQPRDLDDIRPGGLGTHLMREVMDEVCFVEPSEGYGNCLRLVKKVR